MKPGDGIDAVDRMPAHLGVIWGAEQGECLVYSMMPVAEDGGEAVESVRVLGGPFLDLTPALIAAVQADRSKTPAVPA